MKKFSILLTVLLFAQLAVGQNDYKVLFRSGTEIVASNFDEYLGKVVQPAETFDGKTWMLIQFEMLPDEMQWQDLELLGVHRLGYIPNNVFIVSLPDGFQFNEVEDFGVRSIIPFRPHHKISPPLYGRPLPEYAVSGANVRVVLEYFEDVNSQKAFDQLREKNITIEKVAAYGSSVHLVIDPTRLESLASLPWVLNIELPSPPPIKDDTEARSLHRSNMLDASYATGRHYDGTGVSGAIGDDGIIGPHIDYQGRLDQSTATSPDGTHGDMTAGIMMGAGNRDPRVRGHAAGLFLYYFDIDNYEQIVDAPNLHNNFGVMVTSTSYSQGCNAGYTTDTRDGDQMIRQNPSLIHVFSGGNAGTSNCNYGAGPGWGNITGGYKQGKNVIACGNLNNLDVLESSSSRGPADDGRIKPDICANGYNQLSTNGPNTYQVGGGTSAASPSVAGVVAQLYQAYREMNSSANPESSLIKAIMLNTAEDLGNVGPDFQHGWGRVNGFKAVRTLEQNRYLSGTISTGGNNTHNLFVPGGTQELRVMCYWLDYEGVPLASKALVNDLDFTVVTPSTSTVLPWVLDTTANPTNLNAPAIQGVDHLNNMEQVTITGPAVGTYQLKVAGTAVPQGPQKYWIVYEFVTSEITVTYPNGGEGFVAGESEILRWEAYGSTGMFTLEYSLNNGSSWTTITSTLPGTSRQYTWTVPAGLTGQARIRVTRNAVSDMSDAPFTMIGVPQNLIVANICPTVTRLEWDAVSGATGYEVYKLGTLYMDSIGYATNLFFNAAVLATDTAWFSVRAYGPSNAKGRRAVAIQKLPGLACPTPDDAAINQIISPSGGALTSCMDLDTMLVVIEIQNSADNNLTNIPVNFSFDGGSTISETYLGTLVPSQKDTFTFAATIDLSAAGPHTLKVWVSYAGDTDPGNDTVTASILVTSGTLVSTFPYTQNFETFTLCNPGFNCEAASCAMTSGWLNTPNGSGDQIDWSTFSGATPSGGTGPVMDYNPGTVTGKYLYTEASTCFGREAVLLSPCFDLTNTTAPALIFARHMWGSTVASLSVDILSGGSWTRDALKRSGNQGNQWVLDTLDLTAHQGQVITVRFRGMTGTDYDSDIAIDDIRVLDFGAPPSADFTENVTATCTDMFVQFTDASLNPSTAWEWQFNPSTVTFMGGTNANSKNPLVQFNAAGQYDVTLIAANAFGSDTITKTAHIDISNGQPLPFYDNFENNVQCNTATNCGQTVCPVSGWINEANGVVDDIDWRVDANGTATNNTGPSMDHNPGTTAGFYLYLEASNGCTGRVAQLVSQCIDLTAAVDPRLAFWYHMLGTAMGSLHVDVRSEGVWTLNLWSKSGNQGNQWLTDTINLTAFVGSSVQVRFRGITGNAAQSDLAIDDISIIEAAAPVAAFSFTDPVCIDSPIVFTDQSIGTVTTYTWDFGSGATPATAGTKGPHAVTYSTAGNKTVNLAISGPLGSSASNQVASVVDVPHASFNATINSFGVVFTQASSDATSYFWDFGDTNTSTLDEPAHIYSAAGTYQVTMIATNDCGSDTTMQSITIVGTGVDDLPLLAFDVIPNPNDGRFIVQSNLARGLVEVFDVCGRLVHRESFEDSGSWSVELPSAVSSVYWVKVSSESQIAIRKLIVD